MILKALKYQSFDSGKEWSIANGSLNNDIVSFENINLIVGRNASGKTRFIESVRKISDILGATSSIPKFNFIDFEITFQDNEDLIKYYLKTGSEKASKEIKIKNETLIVNDNIKLDRANSKLYYEQLNQFVEFALDDTFLAINRRDDKQQPFFKNLHDWGKNLSFYAFGGDMGREYGSREINDLNHSDLADFKNRNNLYPIYAKGELEHGKIFQENIIRDMARIDYHLDSIALVNVSKYSFLEVQERDLTYSTDFEDMSQGMARAFSLIVQLNYSLMAKIPSCILIDDIGEGLDYDRSKKLIELIIEKAKNTNIQLFMTTNDRFVMNNVPLKYWSVIHREGHKSVFYNYQNSKQTFDDFALTGFNNFDFFTTEFYRLGFEEFLQTAQ